MLVLFWNMLITSVESRSYGFRVLTWGMFKLLLYFNNTILLCKFSQTVRTSFSKLTDVVSFDLYSLTWKDTLVLFWEKWLEMMFVDKLGSLNITHSVFKTEDRNWIVLDWGFIIMMILILLYFANYFCYTLQFIICLFSSLFFWFFSNQFWKFGHYCFIWLILNIFLFGLFLIC